MQLQEKAFILDSSFFLSGFQTPYGEFYTTPQVIDELGAERKEIRIANAAGLRIVSPGDKSLGLVRETAQKSGDIGRLSETDSGLLALALELDGILMTDDYSMQNVAHLLGVKYRPVARKGIRKVEQWYFRCSYCGKYHDENYPDCPVCGGPLKTTRRPPK